MNNQMTFNVGDRVKCIDSIHRCYGLIGTVTSKYGDFGYFIAFDKYTTDEWYILNKYLELVKEYKNNIIRNNTMIRYYGDALKVAEYYINLYQCGEGSFKAKINNNKRSSMSNIISKIKDLSLSPEDRALREEGFEDEDGKMTMYAWNYSINKLIEEKWASERQSLAENILKVKANETK